MVIHLSLLPIKSLRKFLHAVIYLSCCSLHFQLNIPQKLMVVNDLVADNLDLTLVLVLQDHFKGRIFKTVDHRILLNRHVNHFGAFVFGLSSVVKMSKCFI